MKTTSAFDISLGLMPDPVNGQEIKPDSLWVPVEEVSQRDKDWKIICSRADKEIENLKKKLERVTQKLDTDTNAVAAQLVKMTNLATDLQIQKDKVNKILDEIGISDLIDERFLAGRIKRLREVLNENETSTTPRKTKTL
jgi:hypothetical protein